METCVKCRKTIDKTSHITCASCDKTICGECYDKLEDQTQCPMCGHKG